METAARDLTAKAARHAANITCFDTNNYLLFPPNDHFSMSSESDNNNESRPKRYLLVAKGAVTVVVVGVAVPMFFIALPFVFAYLKVKDSTKHQVKRGKNAVHEYKWRRFLRKHQLPPSQPLVNNNNNNSSSSSSSPPIPEISDRTGGRKVGFLHLPIEIRLEIYKLVLPPKSVFQPGQKLNMNTMYSRHGPLPSHWEASQYIRSDEDPPSTVLQILFDANSSFRKDEFLPIRTGSRGRSIMKPPPRLILTSEEPALSSDPLHDDMWGKRHYTNLMRTCRFIYEEVLNLLYGNNTISFFGSESVPFFARNASPEGLLRIRYAHLAISIHSLNWSMPKNKKSVLDAVQCITTSMGGASLRQLDIEIVLTHGQPSEPRRFWAWLTKDVLGHYLPEGDRFDRFVLKVSVLHPEYNNDNNNMVLSEEDQRRERWELYDRSMEGEIHLRMMPRRTRLVTWNEAEYEMLKNEITRAQG